MLRIGSVATGALAVIAVMAAVSGATAQTNDQPGRPLALLAGLKPPHATKTHTGQSLVDAKAAHKSAGKVASKQAAQRVGAVAAKESTEPPAPPRALPDNVQPAPDQAAPENTAMAQPVGGPAPATDDADPGALVVNGQTVQIAPPDQLNDIDRAADAGLPAASAPAQYDSVEAAPAAAVAQAHTDASPIGSASWLAQILAALGGAIAAASVAWFLIGSGPVRTYG